MSASGDIGPDPASGAWPIKETAQRPAVMWAAWPWLALLAAVGCLALLYRESLAYMVHIWSTDENYGHGFFVPAISLYLIWEKRRALQALPPGGSWWGLPLVLAGLGLYFIGEFATLYVVLHLSLWTVVAGLLLAAVGPAGVRVIAFPLLYLLTMIPLPHFLYQGLSGRLQLISSALGVGCLQLVGVTAFRDGNVIDLGPIQLQVVEACSGLRYIFPLASLALLCAYLFRDALWKRALLVLSSFPIAILLNGVRIGAIGVLVELYGQGAAEGFFHFFEGWVLFVASLALLFVEMWALAYVGAKGDRRPWFHRFSLGGEPQAAPAPASVAGTPVLLTPALLASLLLLLPAAAAAAQMGAREEAPPARREFLDFPMQLGGWEGRPLLMEKAYADVLRFDDYLLADYRLTQESPVNLYVAYYRSQKKSQSAHSPRTCIPGGGWEITSIEDLDVAGPAFTVNRVSIQKGDQKQIVLYWFQQRGRILANEYLVKWLLFWDALTRRRTDGALVRLTAAVGPGESERSAEQRLVAFARTIRPLLSSYVPD